MNSNRTHTSASVQQIEINRPSFFVSKQPQSIFDGASYPRVTHVYWFKMLVISRWSEGGRFQSCFSLIMMKREKITAPHRLHVFLCIAQRTEIASALVLNFLLLFQPGALSQTTDVVLQSKISPLLDKKPDLCACIIPGHDGIESWYITINTAKRYAASKSTVHKCMQRQINVMFYDNKHHNYPIL